MIINDDNTLRQYLPNALVTVEGERTLFDKMRMELRLSESWVRRFVVSEEQFPLLDSDDLGKLIAEDAFIRAIPSLDLVLTPNGFGIVSNNTIVPASRDRVDRLLSSLEQNRDFAIDQLLHTLLLDNDWRATAQGRYFLATLLQTPQAFPSALHKGKAWQYFEQTHAQLVLIEQQLAEQYISCEVYARLRNAAAGTPAADEQLLISSLQAIELDLLQGKPLPYKQLVSLVDYIRQREEVFPEWQTSTTAELYKSHYFENTKHSSGYWF